jgi:hypothetical protein
VVFDGFFVLLKMEPGFYSNDNFPGVLIGLGVARILILYIKYNFAKSFDGNTLVGVIDNL